MSKQKVRDHRSSCRNIPFPNISASGFLAVLQGKIPTPPTELQLKKAFLPTSRFPGPASVDPVNYPDDAKESPEAKAVLHVLEEILPAVEPKMKHQVGKYPHLTTSQHLKKLAMGKKKSEAWIYPLVTAIHIVQCFCDPTMMIANYKIEQGLVEGKKKKPKGTEMTDYDVAINYYKWSEELTTKITPEKLVERLDAWDKIVLPRAIGGSRHQEEEATNEQMELQAKQKKWSGNFDSDSACMTAFLQNSSLLKDYDRQSQHLD